MEPSVGSWPRVRLFPQRGPITLHTIPCNSVLYCNCMKKDRNALTITLDPDLRAKLEAVAKREERSLSGQISFFVRSELKLYESEHGEIQVQPEP